MLSQGLESLLLGPAVSHAPRTLPAGKEGGFWGWGAERCKHGESMKSLLGVPAQ